MKGYIDEYGRLFIFRGGKPMLAECRSANCHGFAPCGQGCSRFGEPKPGPVIKLKLCTKTLEFSEFEDRRK